jgi:hypothetical protein
MDYNHLLLELLLIMPAVEGAARMHIKVVPAELVDWAVVAPAGLRVLQVP